MFKNHSLNAILLGAAVLLLTGTALELSGAFERQELQQINRLFEWRYFVDWRPTSLSRLNPAALWQYHQRHEIPKTWWAWDYTINWLIADNHRRPALKFAIFNHLPEDEPPIEAVNDHPWMAPLLDQPLKRRTVANFVRTLAAAGAQAIVLDNDFPQYSPDDKELAAVIHDCTSGKQTGKPLPVMMVRSVDRRSTSKLAMWQAAPGASGVLEELQNLDPGTDVYGKYTGTACLLSDTDQVVRRCLLRLPSLEQGDSLILKTLAAIGTAPAASTPDVMDIDFIAPPDSPLFPVRCQSYLLDPDRRAAIMQTVKHHDIDVHGAIAIVGDGIIDTFNTAMTNRSLANMSGAEIVAQAMDTVAARTWFRRASLPFKLLCLCLMTLIGCATLGTLRLITHKRSAGLRLTLDVLALVAILAMWDVLACLVFTYARLIIPVIVPQVAVVAAFLFVTLFEREHQRHTLIQERLQTAQRRHQSEMRVLHAESALHAMLKDQERRAEFVKRLKHDLKAPLTVINWNLAKLKSDGLQSKAAPEKIERLVKTSDRLYDLLGKLTETYERGNTIDTGETDAPACQLLPLLENCVQLGSSEAEMSGSTVEAASCPEAAYARIDGVALSRILDNLIRNALVHNPPGVHVSVSIQRSGQYHILRVADTGKGIASAHLEKIFEAGYRIAARDGRGSGLGLNIVRTLLEEAGGYVSVASTEGVGTTFFVAVPALASPTEKVEPATTFDGENHPNALNDPRSTFHVQRSAAPADSTN